MSIGFVFGLIAIASGLSSYPLVSGLSWIDLVVSMPPPIVDNNNITYINDGLGHVLKVDIKKVENQPTPYFSVENDVIFQLFTHKNPTEPQILTLNNYTSVKKSNFNWWHPTRILIHGWYSEGLLTPRFAEAYLVKGKHKVNFIAVNWQKGSDVFNYLFARRHVKEVAELVAKFIDFMYEKAWMGISDLTIVGHSLGGHIAGIAGKKITKGKVGKIVGLDPASPLFKYEDVNDRLAETDASYVEVIHTCAGTLGFSQPLGSASFYPNGGRNQPGCGLDITGACAHRRSYEYYLESIYTPKFFAFQCDSLQNLQKGNCSVVDRLVQMGGEPGNKKGRGIYYLQTNSKYRYARGKRGILQAVLSAKKKKSNKMSVKDWIKKISIDEKSNITIEAEQSKSLKSIWMNIF